MPSKKPLLSTRVEDAVKEAFEDRAKASNLSAANLLEQVVLAFLRLEQPEPSALVSAAAAEGEKRKVWASLSVKETQALDELAKEMGWSRSKYLAQLFRVHLSGTPRFSEKELAELRQVTMQLAALGRNVNQIARALNVSLDNANQAQAIHYEQMKQVIELHRAYVKALVKSNLEHWGASDGD